MTIKNKNYKEFLDTGLMKTLSIDQIEQAIKNIPSGIRYKDQVENFIIVSYYTGARPVEVLSLCQGDVYKDGRYVVFKMPGAKNGKSRLIYINLARKFMRSCYEFCYNQFPGILIHYNLVGNVVKRYTNKKGITKEYIEKSGKLRYVYNKIFEPILEGSISPYYLRHNTFSKLSMGGASIGDIKILKGGKSIKCAEYYVHMNVKKAKELARINK